MILIYLLFCLVQQILISIILIIVNRRCFLYFTSVTSTMLQGPTFIGYSSITTLIGRYSISHRYISSVIYNEDWIFQLQTVKCYDRYAFIDSAFCASWCITLGESWLSRMDHHKFVLLSICYFILFISYTLMYYSWTNIFIMYFAGNIIKDATQALIDCVRRIYTHVYHSRSAILNSIHQAMFNKFKVYIG